MRHSLVRPTIATLALASLLTLAAFRGASAGEPEKKLAVDLTHLTMPKESYLAMIDQMSTNLIESMRKSGANVPVDPQKLRLAVADAAPYEEMVQLNAEIYSSKFNAGELNDLIKFYNTPTGKKMARLLPEITGEVSKKMGPILVQRLPGVLKKHGIQ